MRLVSKKGLSMKEVNDDLFPDAIKRAFDEFELSGPCTDPDDSVPPRDVTIRAKKFLSNVNWTKIGPPELYTFDTILDIVWDGLGITVHPKGIDVYIDMTEDRLIINSSVEKALKIANDQKNVFFNLP